MKMNIKYFTLLTSILLAGLFASCTEEVPLEEEGIQQAKGTEIGFKLNSIDTRTLYGSITDEGTIPVKWWDKDLIRIYCAQAEPPVTNAEYIINSELGTNTATMKLNSLEGLRWGGDTDPHTFYGTYPSDNDISVDDKGVVTFPVNKNQLCTVEYIDDVAEPDMKNLYMVASTDPVPPSEELITLTFKPIMTALKITVKARSRYQGDNVKVRGVSIEHEDFSDSFNYNIHTGEVTPSSASNLQKSIIVKIKDGNNDFVELTTGSSETITLTAFLPPVAITDQKPIKIRVLGSNNEDVLTIGSEVLNTNQGLGVGKYNMVSLPNLRKPSATVSNPAWITPLADDILINQLSIPGSHDAAGYSGNNAYNSTQSYSIEEQWNQGIRCFDFSADVFCDRTVIEKKTGEWDWKYCSSPIGGGTTWITNRTDREESNTVDDNQIFLYQVYNNSDSSIEVVRQFNLTLKDVLDKIVNQVKGTDEFAIVMLHHALSKEQEWVKDANNSDADYRYADQTQYKYQSYYFHTDRWYRATEQAKNTYLSKKLNDVGIFNAKMDELLDLYPENTFVEWKPDLTIGECRGKVVLISSIAGGNFAYAAFTSTWSNTKITDLADATNHCGTLKSSQGATGTFYYQDYNNYYDESNTADKTLSVRYSLGFAKTFDGNATYKNAWMFNYLSANYINYRYTFFSIKNYDAAVASNDALISSFGDNSIRIPGVILFDFAGKEEIVDGDTYAIKGNEAIRIVIENNGSLPHRQLPSE